MSRKSLYCCVAIVVSLFLFAGCAATKPAPPPTPLKTIPIYHVYLISDVFPSHDFEDCIDIDVDRIDTDADMMKRFELPRDSEVAKDLCRYFGVEDPFKLKEKTFRSKYDDPYDAFKSLTDHSE